MNQGEVKKKAKAKSRKSTPKVSPKASPSGTPKKTSKTSGPSKQQRDQLIEQIQKPLQSTHHSNGQLQDLYNRIQSLQETVAEFYISQDQNKMNYYLEKIASIQSRIKSIKHHIENRFNQTDYQLEPYVVLSDPLAIPEYYLKSITLPEIEDDFVQLLNQSSNIRSKYSLLEDLAEHVADEFNDYDFNLRLTKEAR